MKKTVALILTLVLIAMCLSIGAGAAKPPVVFGDSNRDYEVDILDATEIQRYLVGISELSSEFAYEYELRADFDRDGELTVLDVTYIQRKEAEIPIPDTCGGEGYADITVTSLYADYDSGKAVVNVPVTFSARSNFDYDGATYAFYIDGVLMQERSDKKTFTHTFTESGDYDVFVKAYNKYGFYSDAHLYEYYFHAGNSYKVVDGSLPEELTLVGVSWIDYMYSDTPAVELHAAGGTAPYTYSYTITDIDEDYVQNPGDWTVIAGKNNRPCLYHDFTEENVMTISFADLLAPRSSHDLIVQAKDANGALSETRTLYFDTDVYIIG